MPVRTERLERLDRPDGSVDLIVMNQVLEHLQEVREVLGAARRRMEARLVAAGLRPG